MSSSVIKGIKDVNNVDITSMSASWVTKPYGMDDFLHLGVHIFWDNPAITGTMELQYTCDPVASNTDVNSWVTKNVVNVDGTFDDILFLDSNVPITAYRLVWQHISGTGNIVDVYHVRKKQA